MTELWKKDLFIYELRMVVLQACMELGCKLEIPIRGGNVRYYERNRIYCN